MRKLATAALLLGMFGVLTGCSMDGGGTTAATSAAMVENKTIAGIVFQEDQFFKLMTAGYEAAAKDLGYDIQLSNVTNDQTKETELVNTYTAQGVAGIAIAPLSATISPEALKVADSSGVKVCVANTSIENYPFSVASYTSDNFALCKQTGDIAVDFIKKKYGDEKIQVGILQFKTQIPETSAERVDGFIAALDEGKINYEVVSNQDAWLQDMAVGKVGDMLAANPDIDILFAANDGGTIGSVMAVENAGLAGSVYVFGTDASEQIVDLLKSDNDILQAVTGQDPFQIGYKSVEALVKAIEGEVLEDQGKTVIVEGIPLKRGDTEHLDQFMEDLKSKM